MWPLLANSIFTVFALSMNILPYILFAVDPGPEVIKLFHAQLSMKFVLLINLKLLTTANSFLLNIAEHGNFSGNKYVNANYYWHFHIY